MHLVSEAFHDGIASLTLNRPEKKNAMSLELLQDLYRALKNAETQGASIVAIRGAGKNFCSGGDVTEFITSEAPAEQVDAMADFLNRSINLVRSIPAIVIAVVEGVAVGAGMSLALAADFTLAETKAVMNMGYRKIGLTPDGGGSIFLPRLVGMKRFNELYFLSRNVTMEEAKEMGLVNSVVDEEDLEEELANLIEELKALPMETTRRMKELVNLSLLPGLGSHLDRERRFVAQFSAAPNFSRDSRSCSGRDRPADLVDEPDDRLHAGGEAGCARIDAQMVVSRISPVCSAHIPDEPCPAPVGFLHQSAGLSDTGHVLDFHDPFRPKLKGGVNEDVNSPRQVFQHAKSAPSEHHGIVARDDIVDDPALRVEKIPVVNRRRRRHGISFRRSQGKYADEVVNQPRRFSLPRLDESLVSAEVSGGAPENLPVQIHAAQFFRCLVGDIVASASHLS